MDEEIVVDDVDDNSMTETQQTEDSTTPVMPLLYIQQGKMRPGQPTTANQTLVSSTAATQLAAIINPVNSQIVTGPNKVYIQGPGQVTSVTSQNKQHIVIHRPVSTVNNAGGNQGQKHILLRKSNTSTAQIVPLNTSSQGNQSNTPAGKHTFAYLGTLIKPNKSRESVVIPAGALTTTQITKPKLVIAPVISQLAQTSTSTTSGSQTQTPKHMTNLLLPVSIPQPSGTGKSNMFNLKINNGQLGTDSKGTITVLRESKTTNSTTHPPPLHPIAKMSLLTASKGSNNSTDSINITGNPDSAVITPIPKKDDSNIPEKRKKTISNILRNSSDKRMKKQSLSKSPQETLIDVTYALSSPESEQEKDKKVQNDDDITLIKVVPSEDKVTKLNANIDDDIKIEIIKAPTSCGVETISDNKTEYRITTHEEIKDHFNTSQQTDSTFDATKILDWKDGVGTLPGSTLKFCMNEFGIMEVVEEDESSKQNKDGNIGDKENVCLIQNSSKSSPVTSNNVVNEKKPEDRKTRTVSADTVYHCEGCGCYGLAAEFESPVSCSPSCTEIIESNKKQSASRKEKDVKDMRAKRKRKKLLQEQQQTKEAEEKPEEKVQEKAKSETDEDTKDTIAVGDEESLQDSAESKYPWLTGKLGFSWPKYLEYCKAKPAPVKLFKDPFPYGKNHFKVGMKLEGIDPEHPSHYCVLTVAEVVGYRIRLHFDGYPENYDFWVNADSMDIFPAGWSEKNGHRLDPPKGYQTSNFNWNAYLKLCKTNAAPKTIFSNKSSVFPTGFRVGMKLEAVDRKHSSLVCVASIAGLMDSRILVHFDSWDEVYDYWADASSPYIHPVGWCHHHGHSLTPPNNYKDPKSFTWDAYLRETRSMAAPARAFKQRPPCGFKRGMKLEAVDKRVPQLIRVATVEDVKAHMLKIRFDGWPENHAYWVDDDSPDIHPMGWCLKTGHPLEPPLTLDNLNDRPECGTHGCRGIGHIKGPKYATHNSASGCPYSSQNLHRVRQTSDRLIFKNESSDADEELLEKSKAEKIEKSEKAEKADKIDKLDKSDKADKTDKTDRMDKTEKPEKIERAEKTERIEKIERIEKTERIEKIERTEKAEKADKADKTEKTDKMKIEKSERYPILEERLTKTENKDIKQEDGDELSDKNDKSENSDKSNKSKQHNSDGQTDDDEFSRKRKKRRQMCEEPLYLANSGYNDPLAITYAADMPDKQLRTELYESVYNPGYNPLPNAPHIWAKHSSALNRVVAKQNTNPRRWSNEEVIKFIESVPNCKDIGTVFRQHNIDGEAFLMLTQEDLVSLLGLRLGPAIKLYNSIVLLRRRAT